MKKEEIKNLLNKEDKQRFIITPDEGKCFQNKRTGHKFIHTITHKGLPLYVTEQEISLYNEVNL